MDIIDAVPMTFISLAKKAKKVKVKKVKAKTVKAKTLKDSVKAQGEFKGKKVKESVEESVEVVKTKKNTYQDSRYSMINQLCEQELLFAKLIYH